MKTENPAVLTLSQPYLLFLGDAPQMHHAKTAFGLRDWAAGQCIAEFGSSANVTTGLPLMTPREAFSAGARSMVIGVVNLGGFIPMPGLLRSSRPWKRDSTL